MPTVRWVSGSKERIDSSASPKKSRRTGFGRPAGIEIDDAAAHRVFARIANRAGAHEAVGLEPVDQKRRIDHVAGRGREGLRGDAGPSAARAARAR